MIQTGAENNNTVAPVKQEEEVQDILDRYKDVFEEPTGFPPQRQHDHHIPLVAGS